MVAVNLDDAKWQMDQAQMASRYWKLNAYDVRKSSTIGKVRWIRAGLRQKFRRDVLNSSPGVLDKAYSRYGPELTALAMRERADRFIAHNLPSLPAAARAAHRWDTRLGFAQAPRSRMSGAQDREPEARGPKQTTVRRGVQQAG